MILIDKILVVNKMIIIIKFNNIFQNCMLIIEFYNRIKNNINVYSKSC